MNVPANVKEKEKAPSPIVQFQQQMDRRSDSFKGLLPAHIPWERFRRVVIRAIQKQPDLINKADPNSLMNAAIDAASDGLLPDGREGAMVIYNTKVKRGGKDVWIKKVQWMPMIAGVLKKVRNSGQLKSITAQCVYAGDQFRHWIDENGEHLHYEADDEPDKSVLRRVFALAVTKDGGSYVEVMDAAEIEKVRQISRAKDKGPWVDWYAEMAEKTVLRRLSKRLPLSTDLDDLIRRDDPLYNLEAAADQRRIDPPKAIGERLDALAGPEDAEIIEPDEEEPAAKKKATDAKVKKESETEETEASAALAGQAAAKAGVSRGAIPPKYADDENLKGAWLAGYDEQESTDNADGDDGEGDVDMGDDE